MMELGRAPPILRGSRRHLIVGGLAAAFAPHALAAGHVESSVSPAEALKRLADGNLRYATGRSTRGHLDPAWRSTLVGGQHPFATIIACADSRVAPELIFDQGLGDLFVIRVAGNVVDDVVMGSLEYSVVHLGVPLVMVLGHEHCGAVTATVNALDGKPSAEDAETKIGALANLIAPAVKAVPAGAADKVEAAVLLNARMTAQQIVATSPAVREHVHAGTVQVFSGEYALKDGRVTELQMAESKA